MYTVGIVAAIQTEAAHLIKSLVNPRTGRIGSLTVFRGDIGDKAVSIIISGVGRRAAQDAAEALIKEGSPDLIISTGFAGGLSPDFPRGGIIVSCDLVNESGERETFSTLDSFVTPPPGKRGVVMTSSHFVSSTRHKKELNERLGAIAVDMESFHVGRVARGAGVPFLVVRVISDDLSHELPVMGSFFTKDGRLDLGGAILYFLRHPATCIPFVRFMVELDSHAKTLNRYLGELIVSL